MYAVPSSPAAEVAVIPEPDIAIVEAYCPVVSVPNATELAAIVAVRVVFPVPEKETEPLKSPPREKVIAFVQAAAVPVILVASITPVVPENTSEELAASGINVKKPVESSNPKKPVFAVPEKYLNSIPRSLLSSVPGLVPPVAVPKVNTGSTNVEIVELTVVVVPLIVKFPVTVTSLENVLEPANVCVPVVTKPLLEPEASGMLNVCDDPEDEILKSLPELPTANV